MSGLVFVTFDEIPFDPAGNYNVIARIITESHTTVVSADPAPANRFCLIEQPLDLLRQWLVIGQQMFELNAQLGLNVRIVWRLRRIISGRKRRGFGFDLRP